MDKPPVAFIIQRYGESVLGGAESLCRAIAERLAPHWNIEVLTTCARDYMTWENELPAGLALEGHVNVWRFPVDARRDIGLFNRQNEQIQMRFHTAEDEQDWMELQGPKSTALQYFISRRLSHYRAFLVFNYLYASTYESLRQVADRAWLVPFAHDEPPIYMRLFEDVFRSPRGIVFSTREEAQFVRGRFPFALPPSEVIGLGIEPPADVNPERFRVNYQIFEPFMLYAGRIDESKGCHDLFEDFIAYRERAAGRPRALALVLCGSSRLTVPRRDDIRPIGYVSEQDKWDALAAARCLVLPSRFESLSIVVLEAWAMGTPVLVNGRCAVSVGQCRRSGGGLWYMNGDEFGAAADWLAGDDRLHDQLGRNGLAFVRDSYQWPSLTKRYLEFIRFHS
jgi:glycosyltransferase involved in cell wall biosynthesis